MAKVLLRDRPDPLPPTVYEEALLSGHKHINPEVDVSGLIAWSSPASFTISGTSSSGYYFMPASTSASFIISSSSGTVWF